MAAREAPKAVSAASALSSMRIAFLVNCALFVAAEATKTVRLAGDPTA